MKHFNKLLFAVLIIVGSSSRAQNSTNPWALSFGINAVDTRGGADNPKSAVATVLSQPFKVKENWNILPSVSYLGLSRSIGNNLSVGIQGSINKITKYVYYDKAISDFVVTNPGKLMYYAVDANVRYSFMTLISSKKIDPSVRLGVGYTKFGKNSYPTFNPGLGLTYWFTDKIGLALETTYKAGQLLGGDRSSSDIKVPGNPSHFQHTAGITFQFGGKDTDGDGIYDKDDACPAVAGLKQFNGCPDTDADGIIDGSDACPNEFGLAAFNGCPDKDGDGIADKDDACPDAAGLSTFKGCPDTDGDGIADKDDKCPTAVGSTSNGGCPILDTDNDGVPDSEDNCPTVAGLASNKGCAEVTPEVIENLKIQAKSVFFNTGKASFKIGDTSTIKSLDAIKEILTNYPNAKFSIEGHTDSDGSAIANQKLSENRASAVRNFLIEKGINPANLTAIGFGESKPIGSNKTKAGKAQNRRTEVIYLSSTK